jgi:hypothetical protein
MNNTFMFLKKIMISENTYIMLTPSFIVVEINLEYYPQHRVVYMTS